MFYTETQIVDKPYFSAILPVFEFPECSSFWADTELNSMSVSPKNLFDLTKNAKNIFEVVDLLSFT